MARTGRRPGVSGTREAILDAARRAFAEQGYQHATIRGVADLAGVDPALVHHYFGTKQGLFVAAMQLPVTRSSSSWPCWPRTPARRASGWSRCSCRSGTTRPTRARCWP